jgi:hypothetical protein
MAAPSVTYTFSNSTTADATQVNTNFTDLVNSLSDGLKDLTISSLNTATLTVSGAATFNGTVALGNATSDDITVTGYIASAILPKTSGSYSLGSTAQNWDALYLDKGATNSGSIYFDAGTTKYIQGNAAGTILTIGGFTSMVPPAAINAAGALTIGTNGSTTALTLSTAQVATFAGDIVVPSGGNIYPGDTTSQLDLFGGNNTTSGPLIRINGSGNGGSIVMNTGSGTTALTLSSTQAATFSGSITLDATPANRSILFSKVGDFDYEIKYNSGVLDFLVPEQSGAPVAIQIQNTGLVYLPTGQIKFPATENASSDPNTLDDYFEFTDAVTMAASSSGTITIGSNASLKCTKIGNRVFLSGYVDVSSIISPVGGFRINGLAYTVPAGASGRSALSVAASNLAAGATGQLIAVIEEGSNIIKVFRYAAGTLNDDVAGFVQNTSYFIFGGHYITS